MDGLEGRLHLRRADGVPAVRTDKMAD